MSDFDRQLNELERFMRNSGIPNFPDLTAMFNQDPSDSPNSIQVGQMPYTIDNPAKAEAWLAALADAWKPFNAGVANLFVEAQNTNREQNAEWFQDQGLGGL